MFGISISLNSHNKKDPDDRSLWISIVLGGLAMLAKESGLTVRKTSDTSSFTSKHNFYWLNNDKQHEFHFQIELSKETKFLTSLFLKLCLAILKLTGIFFNNPLWS